MATRSKWLGGGVFGDASAHVLYTAPPLTVPLVKFVGVGGISGGSPGIVISHQTSGGAVSLILLALPSFYAEGYWSYAAPYLWEALEPGDTIVAQGDGSNTFSVTVSGAELENS